MASLCFPTRRAQQRVALQSVSGAADSSGGRARAWTTFATVWAVVEPLSARERYAAQQAQASTTHRVTIRHRTDVDPSDRVLYDARPFDIVGVRNPEERDIMLILDCVETDPTTTDDG